MVALKYLIVESCTAVASVSVFEGKQCLASRISDQQRAHSEVLNEYIKEIFQETGLSYADLEFVAVDIGPGSFTGVRVGLAIVKTLSYLTKTPIVTYTSTEALAAAYIKQYPTFSGTLLPTINAYKNMVFCGEYAVLNGQLKELKDPFLIDVERLMELDFGPGIILGDGPKAYPEIEKWSSVSALKIDKLTSPLASSLGDLVLQKYSLGEKKVWNYILPLYLKASEAEENLRKGLLKNSRKF